MYVIMVKLASGHLAPQAVYRFRRDAENDRNEFADGYKQFTTIRLVHKSNFDADMMARIEALPVIEPEYERCWVCEDYIPSTAAPILKEKGYCSWRCMNDIYDFEEY